MRCYGTGNANEMTAPGNAPPHSALGNLIKVLDAMNPAIQPLNFSGVRSVFWKNFTPTNKLQCGFL